MKRCLVILSCLISLAVLCGCAQNDRTEERALERAQAYADAINHSYDKPETIYDFLTENTKAKISREDFCAAFAKDRTYPYITPLYLFYPEVTVSNDGLEAAVVYQQAARIIGMTYEVRLQYENGDYYVEDWSQFIDGSYLDKFQDIPYSLDWYFDPEDIR